MKSFHEADKHEGETITEKVRRLKLAEENVSLPLKKKQKCNIKPFLLLENASYYQAISNL